MTDGMLTLAIEAGNPSIPPGGVVAVGIVERPDPGGLGSPGPLKFDPDGLRSPAHRSLPHPGVRVLAEEPIAPATRERDDLLPAIDRVVARAGVKPRDLQRVAVSVGPGGYTALRMAVAAGKMIAWVNGAVCAGVPTAVVAAETAEADAVAAAGETIVVALAGKNESAFVTALAPGWRGGPAALTGRVVEAGGLDGLNVAGPAVLLADGHVPESIRAAAAARGWRVAPPRLSAAALLAASAWWPSVGPDGLEVLYGREPEAVTLWRKRGST